MLDERSVIMQKINYAISEKQTIHQLILIHLGDPGKCTYTRRRRKSFTYGKVHIEREWNELYVVNIFLIS